MMKKKVNSKKYQNVIVICNHHEVLEIMPIIHIYLGHTKSLYDDHNDDDVDVNDFLKMAKTSK